METTALPEGPTVEDRAARFEARGIEVALSPLPEEAVEVFRAYGARDDAVVCNARGAV